MLLGSGVVGDAEQKGSKGGKGGEKSRGGSHVYIATL